MTPRRTEVDPVMESLQDIPMDQLEEMSRNLSKVIEVLLGRERAIQDEIINRLERGLHQ